MNSTNQEAKLKTLPGPWTLGEMTGNWRDIDLPDHGAVMRIVWKMEDDEGRNEALEAQAHTVVAALNAAFPEPSSGRQAQSGAVYAELPEPFRKSGTQVQADGETACTCHLFCIEQMRDYADRTHALRMEQAAPKAAPGEPVYREKWDAELGRTAMRFVDRAGDVHPGIDDAETICAEFHKAMSEVIERMPHVQRMAAPQQEA